MIQRRESELIAQELRNQAKQRQAKPQLQHEQPPAPKSAQPRVPAANTSYNK